MLCVIMKRWGVTEHNLKTMIHDVFIFGLVDCCIDFMSAINLTTVFNDQLESFIQDIQNVFPENIDIGIAANLVSSGRAANAKLLVRLWKSCVSIPYAQPIADGDIEFFLTKDYTTDLQRVTSATGTESSSEQTNQINLVIDRLRGPISNMGAENQAKCMKYIQNLSRLADMIK